MLKLLPKKRYKFYDTFIKSCEKNKCKTIRKSKKCINDKCENIIIPKNKKEILQDFYKQDSLDEQWFNTHHLTQGGGAIDPGLKRIMIKNLSEKYRCPICNKYKNKDSLLEHMKTHSNERKFYFNKESKEVKQFKGSKKYGNEDIVVKDIVVKGISENKNNNVVEKTKDTLKKYFKNKKTNVQTGSGNMRRFTIDKETDFQNIYQDNDDNDNVNVYDDVEQFVQFGAGKEESMSIKIKIPANVRKSAFYAFKLKQYGFNGGSTVGWNIAKQLIIKNNISIEDMRYMRNWFSRHVKISYPIYKKWVDAGRPKDNKWHDTNSIILWLIWSGDDGFRWINSDKNIKLLNVHFNKNYKKLELKS
jgi:hypothetical protein